MSYTDLSQSWKNVTKITTAGALVAALACISGPARADEVISNGHASIKTETIPQKYLATDPRYLRSHFCPKPEQDELTRFYRSRDEVEALSMKGSGQYVILAGNGADMALVIGTRNKLREEGYCVEVARIPTDKLQDTAIIGYGKKHARLQISNRMIAEGVLGGTIENIHEVNGRQPPMSLKN